MADFKYCPQCTHPLSYVKEPTVNGYQVCIEENGGCGFVHYNNPTLAAVMLAPVPRGNTLRNSKGVLQFGFGPTTPDESGLIVVTRGVPPHVNGQCLSSGFQNPYEHPKVTATRELKEETGLVSRVEQIIGVKNPNDKINITTIIFLMRIIDGVLMPGDDVKDVNIYTREELPEICFDSHKNYISRWFEGVYGPVTGLDH